MTTTVLIAGATGMLGRRIARYLLADDNASVRLLVRSTSLVDAEKASLLRQLTDGGASVIEGDLGDEASLDRATVNVDVVISAVQGGPDIIIDGQLALARAAKRNGVRRFLPSDFALDLFKAPEGAPMFDMRRQVDAELDAVELEVIHVLNGGFMDTILDPQAANVVNIHEATTHYWGTGEEPFNLTTIDDTARFTVRIAVDWTASGGVYAIAGVETTLGRIIDDIERISDRSLTRHMDGSIDELRDIIRQKSNPWEAIGLWYFISMLTTPPFEAVENGRYPDLTFTSLDDYLSANYSKALSSTPSISLSAPSALPAVPAALAQLLARDKEVFQQHEKEKAMTQFSTAAHPYVAQNTTAPAYWNVGILWAMLATGDQTAGSYSLMEEWCPKDSGPTPHYHDQDEAFYIVEGTITYLANGQQMQATTGGFVSIPKGIVHSFRVDSESAHILNFYAPAGFEKIILELAEPAPTRTIPPKDYQEPQLDSRTVLTLFQQHGTHLVEEPDVLRQAL